MHQRILRSAVIVAAAVAGCVATGTVARADTIAGSSSVHSAGPHQSEYDYYLALGDSLAFGIQPDSTGAIFRSGHGYADDLATYLSEHGSRNLHYVNLSCPGETTSTMLDGGCPDLTGSGQSYAVQEDAAVAFLEAHPYARILVTLDIGADNVEGCVSHGTLNPTCAAQGIAEAQTQLPEILAQLEAAAGRHVSFVGMNYYDPFLSAYLTGSAGQALATESVTATTSLNNALEAGYTGADVPVADVFTAFQTADFSDTTSLGGMTVPVNVANICSWTWMCAPAPIGPNIHANDAGYAVIVRSFEAQLPARNRCSD